MTDFYTYFTRKCAETGEAPSEVARACGFNPSSVTGWKNGSQPRNSTRQKIEKHFSKPGKQTAEETAITYLFGEYKPSAEEWKLIVKLCDTIKQAHKKSTT